MSDIEGLIRRPTEPSPSSISPLLGTNRLQSAVDHMSKSVDRVSGWLDRASDRLSKVSAPAGGMGSGTTLNGGKQNGGGVSIGGTPMLGAGAANGAAAHSRTPTFMGIPYQQNVPTMTQTYGSAPAKSQTGGKPNGGANWGRYGASLGAVWGAGTVAAGLDRTQSFVASNTSAQLMTRNIPGGDWQRVRTGVVHNNWTATSDQDAFEGTSLLQRSGLGYGSSAWNTQMSQAKNYRMVDPTATFAQAASRMMAPQGVGSSNFLLGRGVNVRGRDSRTIANDIIQRSGFSGSFRYSGDQINAQWGSRGNATMLVSQLAKVDPEMARLVEDQLRGSMQAQSRGMSREAYTKAVNSGDWDALAKVGIRKTDLDVTKDKAARQRNIDDNMAGGFSTGLNNATTALGAFQEALEKITDGPLGAAVGYGHGWAGSSGALGSATHIGGSILGGYMGGKLASSLAKNGVKGTVKAAGAAGATGAAKGASLLAKGAKFAKFIPGAGLAVEAGVTIAQGDDRERRKQNALRNGWSEGMSTYMSWRDTLLNNMTFGAIDGSPDTRDAASGGEACSHEGGCSHGDFGMFGTGGESGASAVKPVGNAPVTAPYGRYKKSGKPHHGIDWGVPTGTPVRASRSGKVVVAGWSTTGFGNHIRIDIGNGVIEIYGHLSQLNVRVGQTVRAGDVIGKSGSTGNSTGPHLHFEVRKGGTAVDPASYLKGADNPPPVSGDAGADTSVGSTGRAGNSLASARSMTAAPWGVNEGEILSGAMGTLLGSMQAGAKGEGDSGQADAPAGPATAASGNLRSVLERAGFKGSSLGMAYAIMMAESGGNARAHNTNRNTGDNSYGLFQINMLGGMGPERRAMYRLPNNDALFDPVTNAKVAYAMSKGGNDWDDWSTYKSGAYKKYLGGQMKSYDVGSTNIDVDQVARVHKGEMILDPVTADEMRKALSSNRPTDLFGGGKGGRSITVQQLTLQTAHQFTDSAATDLAKQFLSIVANHDEVSTIMGGN